MEWPNTRISRVVEHDGCIGAEMWKPTQYIGSNRPIAVIAIDPKEADGRRPSVRHVFTTQINQPYYVKHANSEHILTKFYPVCAPKLAATNPLKFLMRLYRIYRNLVGLL
jgi:hypothetical protein